MKLLHTSDIHYGLSLNEMPFDDVQNEVNEQLLKAVRENNVEGVIIAGDVFDRPVVSHKALAIYDKLITDLYNMGVSVFAIAGNHDAPERLALLGGLLSNSNIFISGKLTKEISPVCVGNADIYLIPYFNFDMVKSLYPDEEFENYQQAFGFVTQKILEKADKSRFNIAVSHCFVIGGQLSDSDHSARIGQALAVSSKVFEGFDYTALGHLHGPHFVGENIRYSGTPFPYSFNETGGEKSFTIIDTDTKEVTTITPEYSRTLRTIVGTTDEIAENAEKDEHKNDFVKIQLTDKFATGELYSFFKKLYPNLLSFEGKIRADAVTSSVLRIDRPNEVSEYEILENYFSDREDQLSDFEREWFSKALEEYNKEVEV
ncbi:MAG: exonuclease SbcCD subunit D [Oscillospiraceae bacterium]|nr:exonuclease SbcCD subunit D [Oscillospiraceae bacterium]